MDLFQILSTFLSFQGLFSSFFQLEIRMIFSYFGIIRHPGQGGDDDEKWEGL